MTKNPVPIAEKLRQLLIESSPLIEEYTGEVCPHCPDLCCKQKHGIFRERDIRYLHALDLDIPLRDEARPQEGPCEFMGPHGCDRPRWMRPLRCTWYFCEPLLAALNNGPQKKARRISAILQEMIDVYAELSASSTNES